MFRLFAGASALALLAALTAAAEDKKDPKDKSAVAVWERESGGIDLRFEMGKDALTFKVFSGENGFVAAATTKADKDGVVKATVTAVEEKGKFPLVPKKGFEFSFKWKETGDKAVLSGLKGEGLDEAKGVVEGEYTKAKPKAKKD